MKKSKNLKVIVANDDDIDAQPQDFIAATGYGNHTNALDRTDDSGQFSSAINNNFKMASDAAK
jgi:hypothetical protein